jgi:transposase
MANHSRAIVLTDADRASLERLQRSSSGPAGLSRRARVVLLLADAETGAEVARRTGYTVVQVSRLRKRFAEEGLAGLDDKPRSGRPPTISARTRAQVVAKTLQPPGAGLTHWSTRDLAAAVGVSHSTVHRLWRAHDLQPHRLETFKFSTDPDAEAKIHDVVGLYLQPPTNAVVLSVDEKTQIQALNRTQPILPLRPGVPARQTHDYTRHGLTSLYAALPQSPGSALPHARFARDSRQLVDTQDARRSCVDRGAPARAFSLHAHRRLVAQHGRGVVQHPDAQVGAPRFLRHRPGPGAAH